MSERPGEGAAERDDAEPLSTATIRRTWWPLAVSWLFMTSEMVITTAVVARLAMPEVNLAAWGIVFAISTVIQAPAVMLLPTSTALSTDGPTYLRLRRMAFGVLAFLTAVHALLAFTPLYRLVVEGLIGAPAEVVDVARVGLALMIPWSFGTGYRRFLQGVLIRFGHSRVVIWGTMVRLGTVVVVLTLGYATARFPGVVVAATAIILGVLGEMAYTQARVIGVVRERLHPVPLTGRKMTLRRFFAFYSPLVLMTVLTMLVQTLVTVVLGRMPQPLESLAVWPVIFGFLMLWQSPGIAYTEVVISLLGEPRAERALGRFTLALAVGTTLGLTIVTVTPLARLWFLHVAGLSPGLASLAEGALWLGLLVPALRVLHSWFQGAIMYSERTRGIMESVLLFLVVAVAILLAGVVWGRVTGIYVGMTAFVVSLLVQVGWLRHRARPTLRTSGA